VRRTAESSPRTSQSRVSAVLARDGDQACDVQVGARAGGTQGRSIVGRAQVRRVQVVVGIDGQAGDAQVARRAYQPKGDLVNAQHALRADVGVPPRFARTPRLAIRIFLNM
jgi:hypothetical protein